MRDRAILSVGLQVGLRRAEIAALKVGDLHQNRGYDSLRVIRKGGRRDALAINPQTAARLRAYLEKAGHGADDRWAAVPTREIIVIGNNNVPAEGADIDFTLDGASAVLREK